MKLLTTGDAGFIGSHLVDALVSSRNNVSVFDNLSSGTLQNNKQWIDSPKLTFIKGDLLNLSNNKKLKHKRFDLVSHLTANPEVRIDASISPKPRNPKTKHI